MFNRGIHKELLHWKQKNGRKPLIIRGARQVGKTTIIHQFATEFKQYIYLNLELPEDKQFFLQFSNMDTLLQSLFFLKNKELSRKHETLLFIDEIQEVPEAVHLLRYFYEQVPELYVVAAGSMLEALFSKNISFPVGRVEYLVLRPVSFPEFLAATGETAALQQLEKIPVAPFAHAKLLRLYHTYALIGGMPEVVAHYAANRDITALNTIYDSLITSYIDDVEKYAVSPSQIQQIRHAITAAFRQAGKRIKFQGFGNSAYASREMGEALRTLQKTMLIHLLYPVTETILPILPDSKKSPRLQVLDTGMLNYFAGIQKEIIGTEELNDVYKGIMIEHLTGQELLATQTNALSTLHFWVREKNTSSAEVDFIRLFDSKLIPIEVKSGKEGKLKSLHQYMEVAPHSLAVRVYGGELQITVCHSVSGKKYFLLNLPYYLVSQIDHYLKWLVKQQSKL
ncbi:MAG TPA: AAA family ATPase [Chitinophagales bacterium]|nr:ATP-binding protein [Chitinophagales bacterium]HPA36589.1 AAA family ATPase [Chitinophagales bacterium]HQO32727.1 AAA family ATPase [Chitinophagales bacterium]HQO90540.1 AAA family ATPase [Chitinophagales bacterium]